jgi:hypothetical protein
MFVPLSLLSSTPYSVGKFEAKNELAENFKIKITNPSGLIIMGRTVGLSEEQIQDFEVIFTLHLQRVAPLIQWENSKLYKRRKTLRVRLLCLVICFFPLLNNKTILT